MSPAVNHAQPGRIGYCCVNLTLQKKFRTMHLSWAKKNPKTWLKKWKEVVCHNLALLGEIIRWNQSVGIRLYRLSSDLVPFADHVVFGRPWRRSILAPSGWWARALVPVSQNISASLRDGHRYSMHPGQFVSISSSSHAVRQNSIRNLEYHATLMDELGLPRSLLSPINIHIGNGSKGPDSVPFVKESIKKLSHSVMSRLVFENEQSGYWTPSAILRHFPEIPVTLDYHHLLLNPDPVLGVLEVEEIITDGWRDCRPICHWSEGKSCRLDPAHSDFVTTLPNTPFDIEVEAKGKDLAVLPFVQSAVAPPAPAG